MADILIIDDNRDLCRTLQRKLERQTDHRVQLAHTLADGLEQVRASRFDVVFLDVMMPDGNGLETLPLIRKTAAAPEVIIITGKGGPEGAALAIESGAWDYIQKGDSLETLLLPLERALQYRRELKRQTETVLLKRTGILGESPALLACLDGVARAALTDANVLIQGETGTGKELFARAVHQNSRRREKNLVVLDCGSVPEKLLESMIFGHEKGAFTGADKKRAGLIKEADGGTLFLDEVGELPLYFQKAFLRVLQEGTFRPLGSDREDQSDFRVVAATNRDLNAGVQAGWFRQDLLYRLNPVTLTLPPLRDRKEDLPATVMHYLAKICAEHGFAQKGFSPEFMDALVGYDWPGNVRELVHVLQQAVATAGDKSNLYPQFLPAPLRVKLVKRQIQMGPLPETPEAPETAAAELPGYRTFRKQGISQLEKSYLEKLLAEVGGDIPRACERSGLSKSQIYKLLKKHYPAKTV